MIFPNHHLTFGQKTLKMCITYDEKFLNRVAFLLSFNKNITLLLTKNLLLHIIGCYL